MAAKATTGSTVSFGGTPIEGLASMTMSMNRSPIDITELGNTFKKYIAGQSDATCTIEVFYDGAAAGHVAIESSIVAATTVAVIFTAHSGATYSFTAMVQDISISTPVNDVVKATFTLQCVSAVTIV
jgi:predicted secreted protein